MGLFGFWFCLIVFCVGFVEICVDCFCCCGCFVDLYVDLPGLITFVDALFFGVGLFVLLLFCLCGWWVCCLG